MPRKPRFAPPGYYLHITQRGNYRQRTFFSDRDYLDFLSLVGLHADHRHVDLLAYCIMSNHFHLIARGHSPGNISCFMQGLSGQYAQLLHGRLGRRGRLWQERFYSCVLDNSHLVAALRYVELNPVRARIVSEAPDYAWSSAAIHTRGGSGSSDSGSGLPAAANRMNVANAPNVPDWLDLGTFQELFADPAEWEGLLRSGQSREERAEIRRATQWERPLGRAWFAEELESRFGVKLLPKAPGRPTLPPRIPPQMERTMGEEQRRQSGSDRASSAEV